MKLGVFASVSEIIDYDTAALVAMELGCKVEKEVIVTVEERLIDDSADKEEDLSPAPPSWWSWATSTTARPPCSTTSATPTSSPARPAASPSTSAPIP
jgi:bacterial translation initiation factor 2 (bIF-2)